VTVSIARAGRRGARAALCSRRVADPDRPMKKLLVAVTVVLGAALAYLL
jgi:hypothetical protein